MKKFILDAYFVFKAENLEDAFNKLSEHFLSMNKEDADSQLIINGKCDIKPISEEEIISTKG
jgi:hypothetical protein